MSDHGELKMLADACPPPGTYHYQSKEWANLMAFQAAVEDIYESDVGMAKELIAEIEALKHQADSRRKLHSRECMAMNEVQGELIDERDKALAEVEALRKDADRYRWLRNEMNDVAITFGVHSWEDLSGEFMDSAVDAAMSKGDQP